MNVLAEAVRLFDLGEPYCLAVVVGKSGSAPQVPGAKGIFLRDGGILGTIGGGCLEMEARRLGLEALASHRPALREFKLDDDFGWDDGLICGGRVQVLLLPNPSTFASAFRAAIRQKARGALVYDLDAGSAEFESESDVARRAITHRREVLDGRRFAEPILPPERLVVYGGGHIGREIARLGASLGFDVTIVDDRPEFVSESRVPWAAERVCMAPDAYASKVESDGDTYHCLVTRGHRNDARVLRELIGKDRAFLGMIGSRRKREVVRKEMIGEAICTQEEFDVVRCPMGLDIGGESVEEIAVSIAAELVSVRAARRGPILARCGQKALTHE